MTITLLIIALLFLTFVLYVRQKKFGKSPDSQKITQFEKLPNYKGGEFHNIHLTPMLKEGYSMPKITYDHFFKKAARRTPTDEIPSIKTNLKDIPNESNVLVWFGHSSYFIQVDGKKILLDPVFSGNASPIPGTNRSFKGTDNYTTDDLPKIDYLFITHDHYDHLDYETINGLKSKVARVICGLGVGSHLEHWGYSNDIIQESNWGDKIDLESRFSVYCKEARHFSGRGFKRNKTLWVSFLLKTPSLKIYMGGDSGYDTHFKQIGEEHGPIDIAILENGQYNMAWQLIHAIPNEVLKAAEDLKAKRVLPVHSSKFAMANHAWDDPLIELTELNKTMNMPLVTPKIGEVVSLDDDSQEFEQWWKEVK